MNYRYDLAQWRRKQTGESYGAIAERAGIARQVVYETVRGENSKGLPANPKVETIKVTFQGLGLDPKYALDFKLKKSEFRRAVVATAR